MKKYTIKYWATKEDYIIGESDTWNDDYLFEPAMSKAMELLYKLKMYAVEVFETLSGKTVYHSEE
jgi:hypothetical protein